jgi:hypothetical protein
MGRTIALFPTQSAQGRIAPAAASVGTSVTAVLGSGHFAAGGSIWHENYRPGL